DHGPNRKRPDNAPALHKQEPVVVAGKDPGILQQIEALVWDAQRPSKDECADRVRRNNYRHEGQKWIIDESAGIDRDLIEAKKEGDRRGRERVQAEERREGDENSDRKSKRRPLRWIIDRKQTAKCCTEH